MSRPLIPIAISSQIDDSGRERIHMAQGNYGVLRDQVEEYNNFVYEMEQGWGFDGGYIPHYLELNWYFGDNPITYHSIQKIRVHGLSKGRALVQVRTNGVQTDYDSDYTDAQWLDLPLEPQFITPGFYSVTNYVDIANRGISIQMKFEGRNEDIQMPEPAHVLQVLVVQSSPVGTGFTAN